MKPTDWLPRTEKMNGACACPICDHVPHGMNFGCGLGELVGAKGTLTCGNCGFEFPATDKPEAGQEE